MSGPGANGLLVFAPGRRGVYSVNQTLTDEAAGLCPGVDDVCETMRVLDWNGDGKADLVFTTSDSRLVLARSVKY